MNRVNYSGPPAAVEEAGLSVDITAPGDIVITITSPWDHFDIAQFNEEYQAAKSPPVVSTGQQSPADRGRPKGSLSPAARKKIADAQRKRWSEYHRQKADAETA